MRRAFPTWQKALVGVLGMALALAGVAWVQHDRILAWYCIRGLTRAGEGDRDAWAKQAAGLDTAIVPALIDCLHQDAAPICANAQAALACLIDRWGASDPRTTALWTRLTEAFARMSAPGRESILELHTRWLQSLSVATPAACTTISCQLLTQAAHVPGQGVRSRALTLARWLLRQPAQDDLLAACRALAEVCLAEEDVQNRVEAVNLALHPGMDLLKQLVPLLRDPAPEVRRAAMVAVGPVPDAIATEDLLTWLHDPDADVCRLCEEVLRSRGLREQHLKLGRLKTDGDPRVRLKVVQYLPYATDLDSGVWLRSLSQDEAPAVRAAAIRAAAEQTLFDLTDRIVQMAQADPSPTVRQLARHYLDCRKSHSASLTRQ